MSPLKQSTNIAARMGRWSARHRKTAIFGWLAFVVASVVLGGMVGTKTIDQNDINVGEARTADHIIRDAGFKLDRQMEYVLVQSPTKTATDPAFRAVVDQAIAKLDSFPKVTELRSPFAKGNEGQVSEDGHAVLIQFSPKGTYDEAAAYIDEITAGTEQVQTSNPAFTVVQAGSASTGKALDEMFGSQLARAGMISIPITLVILMLVFGSLVGALIPLGLALTAVMATMGLVALPSQIVPMDEAISEVILLIGLAVGVDYSLFYIRRERDERRAGRSESAALEAAAATSGTCRPHLRLHGDDRDGRHVLLRRQDVHVVRDRDDDGRCGGDDRLAHGPPRDALLARRPRRQGAHPVRLAPQARRRPGADVGRNPRSRAAQAARLGDRRDGGARGAGASRDQPADEPVRPRGDAEVPQGSAGLQQGAGRVPGRSDAGDRGDQGRRVGSRSPGGRA